MNYVASVGGYVVKGNGFTDTLLSAEQIRFDNGSFWVEDLANMTTGVHRFYNTATNTHFFTGSNTEAYNLRATAPQFIDEGFAFSNGTTTGGLDVFRFLNKETGAFFYTISTQERDNIRSNLPLFEYQASSFKAFTSDRGPQEELYRFYNSATNSHFFTASEAERDNIIATLSTYKYEGIAFYVDILS